MQETPKGGPVESRLNRLLQSHVFDINKSQSSNSQPKIRIKYRFECYYGLKLVHVFGMEEVDESLQKKTHSGVIMMMGYSSEEE